MKTRTEATRTKHLVAKVSRFGWAFKSSVEDCEGRVGHIDISTLRFQEKAYLAHKRDVGDKNPSDSEDHPKRGRSYNKNQKKKKAAEDLRGTSGGGVSGAKEKAKGKGKKRKGPLKRGVIAVRGPTSWETVLSPMPQPSFLLLLLLPILHLPLVCDLIFFDVQDGVLTHTRPDGALVGGFVHEKAGRGEPPPF